MDIGRPIKRHEVLPKVKPLPVEQPKPQPAKKPEKVNER